MDHWVWGRSSSEPQSMTGADEGGNFIGFPTCEFSTQVCFARVLSLAPNLARWGTVRLLIYHLGGLSILGE